MNKAGHIPKTQTTEQGQASATLQTKKAMKHKKVLIIGHGGREHALGWNIAQSPDVADVVYCVGNAGTFTEVKSRNEDVINFHGLAELINKQGLNLTIVGPEDPLAHGIIDYLTALGYKGAFGPTKLATQIESDKFFSYDIMEKLEIPQAKGIKCYSLKEANKAIKNMTDKNGVVLKARGLTAGKGVSICNSKTEALDEIAKHANNYGQEVLISERLFGEEFSVFGISDGKRVFPFAMSFQDHKPIYDGDKGPNTGGMGAYGPAPVADEIGVKNVSEKIMNPIVQEMAKRGIEYKGFMYVGMMMTDKGPKVIEINARFGDPECQPAMMMLKDSLYMPISLALEGKLDKIQMAFKPGAACCVAMASKGYPGEYKKGLAIGGLEQASKVPNVKIFHAGTVMNDGQVVTNGGRVLGVTGYSEKGIEEAQQRAYQAVNIIDKATIALHNNNKLLIYRTDIAAKAIGRK